MISLHWHHISHTRVKENIVRAVSTHRRVGGKELDGFNGNVVKKLISNEEMLPRKLYKKVDMESPLSNQTEKLKVFMPSKRFNITKGSLPLKTKDLKFDSQSVVNKFFREEFFRCTAGNIADMMHTTVKVSRKNLEPSYLSGHLLTVSRKLETLAPSDWTFREIATITYGLQCSKELDVGVAEIMTVIINAASQGLADKLPLRPQDISMMLLGLQEMSHKQPRTRELLSIITSMIDSCSDNFDEQNVGNALRGLQRMSSDCSEVRRLLSALTNKARNCPNHFSSKAIGNALFGLQCMSSGSLEVDNLLKELTQKVMSCTAEFSAQTVSDCMLGVKSMRGNNIAVRSLLKSLGDKFEASTRCLNAQQTGTALYGLREMDDDNEDVCRVITILKHKLLRCPEEIYVHSVCFALCGMQCKNTNNADVRTILSDLNTKFLSSNEFLSPQDLSNVLYGFNSMKSVLSETENVAVLKILYDNAKGFVYGEDNYFLTPKLDFLKFKDLFAIYQSLSLALSDIGSVLEEKTNNYKSWERIYRFLGEEVASRRKNGNTFLNRELDAISSAEVMKLTSSLKNVLEGSDVTIQENCYFLDAIPCDILLQIPLENKCAVFVNLQVNFGSDSLVDYTDIRTARREKFLNKHGVLVYDIRDSKIRHSSDSNIVTYLEGIIRRSRSVDNIEDLEGLDIPNMS